MKKLSQNTKQLLLMAAIFIVVVGGTGASVVIDIDATNRYVPWVAISFAAIAAVGSIITVTIAFRKDSRERRDVAAQVDRLYIEAVAAASYHLDRARKLHAGLDAIDQVSGAVTHLDIAANHIADVITYRDVPDMETSLVAVNDFSRYMIRFTYERTT